MTKNYSIILYNKNSNKRQSSFNSLPQIFVANLGGEYCVPEGIDVVYPNPGPSVENTSNSPGNAQYCESGDEVPGLILEPAIGLEPMTC